MVTIALGGDTMLGRMVGRALAHRPPASVWDPELLEVFREADLAIVKLVPVFVSLAAGRSAQTQAAIASTSHS